MANQAAPASGTLPPPISPSPLVSLSSLSLVNVRLGVTAVLHSLGCLSCVRMCPALTTKNWNTYRPLLALGTQAGHLQVVNVSTGCLERDIAVHSAPVRASLLAAITLTGSSSWEVGSSSW